ncbi:MAG: TIR domain-containing protein [Acetatifactor sp.]|nr:TIR domain-containing protein [Acetatifactor sp.]
MEEKKAVREYVAFISYRHTELDKKVAKKVHYMVEHYIIPKELRKNGVKKLGKVFRDEEELPLSSNLTDSIQTALDHSQFLIVICTPNLPKSVWCEREITYFIEKHGREHVIGILVDGTPDESFPKPLVQSIELDENGNEVVKVVEPLAANLTDVHHRYQEKRLHKEAVRLYAALLDCPFDSLWQREKRQKMRRLVALMGLGMTVALAFSASIYVKNLEIQERNRQIEEQNAQISAQNDEIKLQYNEIQKKSSDLRRSEAAALISEAELLYENGNVAPAAERAIRAVTSQEGHDDFAADAEYVLYRAIGAGQYDNTFRTVCSIEQEEDVDDLVLSDDGTLLYSLDTRGFVRCFRTEDGKQLWKGDVLNNSIHVYATERKRLYLLEKEGLILVFSNSSVAALSLEDGSRVWIHKPSGDTGSVDFSCLSEDGQYIAVIDRKGMLDDYEQYLVILDAITGDTTQVIALDEALGTCLASEAEGNVVGTFSEDNRYVAGALQIHTDSYFGCNNVLVFLADLQEGTAKVLMQDPVDPAYTLDSPFTIGIHVSLRTQSVMYCQYDTEIGSVRMDQIFFDGKIGNHSEVPQSLTARELSNPYSICYETCDNNGLIVSCCEMKYLYRVDNGELITYDRSSNAAIMQCGWFNEGEYFDYYVTDDGNLYLYYESKGVAIGRCGDKIHLVKQALTKDFLINQGQVGIRLAPTATRALVCDDDWRCIYVQKPSKDPEVQLASFGSAQERRYEDKLLSFGEGGLVHFSQSDDEHASLCFIDAATQETTLRYDFDLTDLTREPISKSKVSEGVFWDDKKHFTYLTGTTSIEIYDLEKGQIMRPLKAYSYYASSISPYNGGTVHAAVSSTDDSAYFNKSFELRYSINSGEYKTLKPEQDQNFVGPGKYAEQGFVVTGECGYVVVGVFDDPKKDEISKYIMIDAGTGNQSVISAAAPGHVSTIAALGKKNPVLAVVDDDGYLRWYLTTQSNPVMQFQLPMYYQDVLQMEFCNDDKTIAIWSADQRLYLFETTSGVLKLSTAFEHQAENGNRMPMLHVQEDPARNRLYFSLDQSGAICIDLNYWKKTADWCGMDAFVPSTNEIFRIKTNAMNFGDEDFGIIHYKAYTLTELVDKAQREGY